MSHASPNDNLTPAMRQYQHFKAQYPQAILFFRMGDFYETFYEDAKTCSRVLGIALTSRSKGADAVPLAGVPYHAVDSYLQKMIRAGYKVAICEQVEDPALAKGLVKRDVVRLVTPGTLTEEALLDERTGNYLAAICFQRAPARTSPAEQAPRQAGLAWVELSTGQFFAETLQARHVLDELVRLRPAECLLADDPAEIPADFSEQVAQLLSAAVTRRPAWLFDPAHAAEVLCRHFRTAGLDGFGFPRADLAVAAAGVVLDYLNETQKTTLAHIAQLRKVSRDRFLQLDQTTLRSLEIERTLRDHAAAGSLLHCLDATVTAMGARKLRLWLCYPLTDLTQIEWRQDAVAEMVQNDALRDELRRLLAEVADVERITARVSTGRASPRDLLALGRTLAQIPTLRRRLAPCTAQLLVQLTAQCDTLEQTCALIHAAIDPNAGLSYREGGVIRTGYDPEVDRLRSFCRDGQTWLAEYQRKLITQTNIPTLKVGFNQVFGYYVEITNAQRDKVPAEFVRKQTIKNAERYITDELKQYESQALTAEERAKKREAALFEDVRRQVAAQTPRLQQLADALAKIDLLAAFAHLARHRNYCRPRLHAGAEVELIAARHPVLDVVLSGQFVPNDLHLGGPHGDLLILTGPNMAGKSTYIRQAALLVVMAQMGSFIPAESASLGLVDRIFTRIGAADELARGQSTFMVEMIETANIVNNATNRALVILDEVGRGTRTYDGLALAWALTEHLAARLKVRTLFATHYHEITELADLLPNVRNFNVAVREWKDEVVFLHKIVPGRTDKSYGIHVARLAGVPRPILERAGQILDELENSFAREAHAPTIAGALAPAADDQRLPFDTPPPDAILEKLRATDLNNLTPLQAINLLHEIKSDLEKRG